VDRETWKTVAIVAMLAALMLLLSYENVMRGWTMEQAQFVCYWWNWRCEKLVYPPEPEIAMPTGDVVP
jgi:hypothetical protein